VPSGYLIDAEGEITSELALNAEMLLGLANGNDESGKWKAEMDQARDAALALTKREETDRANRFSRHSLARSKIKRDGLRAGTLARIVPDASLVCATPECHTEKTLSPRWAASMQGYNSP
jgi:hypothetical protein